MYLQLDISDDKKVTVASNSRHQIKVSLSRKAKFSHLVPSRKSECSVGGWSSQMSMCSVECEAEQVWRRPHCTDPIQIPVQSMAGSGGRRYEANLFNSILLTSTCRYALNVYRELSSLFILDIPRPDFPTVWILKRGSAERLCCAWGQSLVNVRVLFFYLTLPSVALCKRSRGSRWEGELDNYTKSHHRDWRGKSNPRHSQGNPQSSSIKQLKQMVRQLVTATESDGEGLTFPVRL